MHPLPDYLPALLTPFTLRGEIDLKAHTHNMRSLADFGVEGFLIGGSTGEGPYLEPGERASLIKAGRRRKTHLMAGIAAESTRMAMSLLAEVTEAGADSVLVMTPTTLARGREEAVARHYTAIADQSEIPVLLYSVPAITSYNLSVGVISKLSRHRNIIGMKDSSGDVVRLQSIVDDAPGDFALFNGSSRALTAAMTVGCRGSITASGNYAAELVMRVMASAKDGSAPARRLQKRLSRLAADVETHGVPGIKAAARAAGLKPGHPRLPLTRLSRGAETSIAKLIT